MKFRISGLVGGAFLAVSISATATPITWNLQDVTFNDGGSATGSFVYDAVTNTYSSIDIQTTGNLAFTYTTADLLGYAPIGFDVATGSSVGAGFLQLITESALTDIGGIIPIGTASIFQPFETTYAVNPLGGVQPNYDRPPYRFMLTGYVTSVPEPATLGLFALGFLAIGFVRARKAN